jgi:single-stranded-DNA-specific exonuclease
MQLLANRGQQGAEVVRTFMRAEWRRRAPELPDMQLAVERLRQAGARAERVTIFGDYDADGVTSCAVLLLALRAAGLDAHPYLPSRQDDGRGLNAAAVQELARNGVRLIVTTDGGSSNVEEVRLASSLGVDVIVTDHHPPQGEMAPTLALVNPRRPGYCATGQDLAGVGVAFRVAEALLSEQLGGRAEATLLALLDLVAVGTLGDLAPLTPENWALVHTGLELLNANRRPGLRALAARAGLEPGGITERDVAFGLVPRLNAAGRMDDPMLALRLLVSDDPAEAARLARQLDALNEERQRVTDAIMAQARAQAQEQLTAGGGDPAVLVASREDWPLGIVGLVAARLAEEFGRPAMAVSRGAAECRGSVRGPVGLNLVETLAQRGELFRRFGGHAQAAGFTLPTVHLDTLISHLQAAAAAQRQDTDAAVQSGEAPAPANAETLLVEVGAAVETSEHGEPPAPILAAARATRASPAVLRVDCRLPLRRIVPDTYAAIRQLGPYGAGFPEPMFLAAGVRVARGWRSGPDGRNLRLVLRDTRDGGVERSAFWARRGDLLPCLRDLGPVDVVYALDLFPARPGFQAEHTLRVLALRPAGESQPMR